MTRLLLALLCLAAPSFALTRGGGSQLTDCLAEFSGTPANRPASRPRDIRCIDGDPTCDDDPTPGVCRFHVGVCLNVTDPNLPACGPADLEEFFVENAGRVPPLGSVKANLGHLLTVAGFSSALKVILAMRHGIIPATPGVHEPLRVPECEQAPQRVVRAQQPWPDSEHRRAGSP